jgi:hypothetical protein
MTGTAATIITLIFLAAGAPAVDAHLLEGAHLFRENRFSEALVEFRMAERLGSAEAPGYVAASLVKLARPEDALQVFERAGAPAAGADPLLDYYHARACYDLKLFLCADQLLAGVGSRTGPRIGEQAEQIRRAIAAALAREPASDEVGWYLERARAHAGAARPVLARAFVREAKALGGRRGDRYGVAEADGLLATLDDSMKLTAP